LGAKLYPLYDEDLTDTDQNDDAAIFNYVYKPKSFGIQNLIIKTWDTPGNSQIQAINFYNKNVEIKDVSDTFIDAGSNLYPALAINMGIPPAQNTTFEQIIVVIENLGGFSSSDLAALTSNSSSGIAIYKDSGDTAGVFDSKDEYIPTGALPFLQTTATACTVLIQLSENVIIPNDDAGSNAGADYYVVLKTSSTIDFKDSFIVSIPDNGIFMSTGRIGRKISTDTITATIPLNLTNIIADTETVISNIYYPAIGIDVTSSGRDAYINKVIVTIENINGFTMADLADIITENGLSLWTDDGFMDNIGTFNLLTDIIIPLDGSQSASGSSGKYKITLTPQTPIVIPMTRTGAEIGNDIYVVFKPNNNISYNDSFKISIEPGDIIFNSPFTTKKSIVTGNIKAGGNINFPLSNIVYSQITNLKSQQVVNK